MPAANVAFPPHIDWRDFGAVSSVKSQGDKCACCYAIAAVSISIPIYTFFFFMSYKSGYFSSLSHVSAMYKIFGSPIIQRVIVCIDLEIND